MNEGIFFPLLTGSILSIAGCIQYFFPPKKINGLYGYRTAQSMQNEAKWHKAQFYSAKRLIVLGLFLLILAPITQWLKLSIELQIGVFMPLLILGVVVIIVQTERFLKNSDR